MHFKKAVEKTKSLADAYRPGLQALKDVDRRRIECENTQILAGSVDLDGALVDSHPEDPRWDYGIGICKGRNPDRVIWVEVHPASSTHIQDMLNKLDWLKRWLAASAPLLKKMTDEKKEKTYVWVASGRVHLLPNSPQRRKLAARGIHFAGSRLRV